MYNQRRRQQRPAMTPEQMEAQAKQLKKCYEAVTSPRAKRIGMTILGLTLLGIFLGTVAPSPVSIDDMDKSKYQAALVAAEHVPGYHQALDDLNYEQAHVDEAKVWFWRFRSEHRARVNKREEKKSVALARFTAKQNEKNALVSQAKAAVGIWSPYGIEETKAQFWQTFQEGKDMGKRMTFYDMFFSMFQSNRDENAGAFFARWAIKILMNYTIGMFVSIIRFLFQLGSIVWSYSPNPASGILFFCVAMFSACSLIGAFVLLIWGSCIGIFSFCAKQGGANGRRGQNDGYDSRRVQDHNHSD